jgi:hypothetical protein
MRTLLFASYWWWFRPTYDCVQASVLLVQIRIATQIKKRQRRIYCSIESLV